MNEIGGYFPLETGLYPHQYPGLIALNSARNALVYVIRARKFKDILLPYLNCHVVANAIRKHCPKTVIHFYNLDANLLPLIADFPGNFPVYYVNYYGLAIKCIKKFKERHLIVDNAQAFYSQPIHTGDTIYCPRKFFGVSDGGYLKTDKILKEPLKRATSWKNSVHLLKRLDCGASAAYKNFQAAEVALNRKPLMKMSLLTTHILSRIEHDQIIKRRRNNFAQLHRSLGNTNVLFPLIELAFSSKTYVPFCYPYMVENAEFLRNKLIKNSIYIPIYWPELRNSENINDFEKKFVNKILCLPIDQRYCESDMLRVLKCLGSNV